MVTDVKGQSINRLSDSELLTDERQPGRWLTMTDREKRLYSVVQWRCNDGEGHTCAISNRVLMKFADMNPKALADNIKALSTGPRLQKGEKGEDLPGLNLIEKVKIKKGEWRYWLLDPDGNRYTGDAVTRAQRILLRSGVQRKRVDDKDEIQEDADGWLD